LNEKNVLVSFLQSGHELLIAHKRHVGEFAGMQNRTYFAGLQHRFSSGGHDCWKHKKNLGTSRTKSKLIKKKIYF